MAEGKCDGRYWQSNESRVSAKLNDLISWNVFRLCSWRFYRRSIKENYQWSCVKNWIKLVFLLSDTRSAGFFPRSFHRVPTTPPIMQVRNLWNTLFFLLVPAGVGWGALGDVRGFPHVALKHAYIEILGVYFLFHGFLLVENWRRRTWILRLGTRNSLPKLLTWKMRRRSSSPNLNRCSYLTSSKTRTLSKKEMNYKGRFQSYNY